jgi:hypothetical protein
MSRNRIFYPVISVNAGPNNPTGYHFSSGSSGVTLVQELQRVQNFSWSWKQPRQNILTMGQLAPIDLVITEQPTVDLECSWYMADLSNEQRIGLYVSGNLTALTNILNQTENVRNMFVGVGREGDDWVGEAPGLGSTFSFLNAYFGSYRVEAAVGGIPTATATFKALNFDAYTGDVNVPLNSISANGLVATGLYFSLPSGTTGNLTDSVSALRANDIQVSIGSATLGVSPTDLKLQSFSIAFDLSLDYLKKLGQMFAYSIQPKFPVAINTSISAYIGDLASGDLAGLICNDQSYNLTFTLNQPACPYSTGLTPQITMQVLGSKIDGESTSLSVSDTAETIKIDYIAYIGGSNDQTHGLTLSGLST